MNIPPIEKSVSSVIPDLILPPTNNSASFPMICFSPNMIITPGIFRSADHKPYLYAVTLFLIQLLIVIATSRGMHFLLRPLKLPRHVSEIIGGFLLGPSVLGRIPKVAMTLFPPRSLFPLESLAYLGLVYYIFTIGLGIDVPSIRSSGWRCFWFAIACTFPPFALAAVSGSTLHKKLNEQTNQVAFVIFISVSFSVSAFSVLARTVTELKIVSTDIGRLTLSAAILVDSFAWFGLSAAVAISESGKDFMSAIYTVLAGTIFYVVCFALVRPMMRKLSQRAISGHGNVGEFEEVAVLAGVLLSAFLGDLIGIHAVFGAFTYGLAIPQGPISASLVEKVYDLVRGILLPLFFVCSGLMMDISSIKHVELALYMAALVLVAALLKVLGGVMIAACYDMQVHDGVSFGLLMNTKGVIELAMLNVAFNKRILGTQAFTILVIMSVVLTAIVTPFLNSVVKPTRRLVFYKRRTVHWNDQGSELRILACVHNPRDVPALISVIDCTYPTIHTPISVSAVQLIELTGHTPALLLLHDPIMSGHGKYGIHLQAQSVAVAHAFECYAQQAGGVFVRTSAAISPFLTMHEDIVAEAENCHAAMVLVPFHMQLAVDGSLEVSSHPSVRNVNKKVMELSPCTVAVIVDRGIGGFSAHGTALRVGVLFFGGPDDRESLALGSRMMSHPGIEISIVRFMTTSRSSSSSTSTSSVNSEDAEIRERHMDDECLRLFVERSAVAVFDYREHVVANAEDTVEAIRRIESEGKELLLVGKEQGLVGSRLTAGMTEWSEFHELGPIGDLLASTDFGATASVLVIQAPLRGRGLADSTISGTMPEESVGDRVSTDQS
ncbi:cation/H(+) antiporter 15-like [Carex rostrata]